MSKQVYKTKSVRVPETYREIFEREIKPLGLYTNYPDFVRAIIRKEITRVLKGRKLN